MYICIYVCTNCRVNCDYKMFIYAGNSGLEKMDLKASDW